MEVVVLGTAAGRGWPDPLCACASCSGQRAAGDVRGPAAVTVDATLLLGSPTDLPRAAAAGDLSGVRFVVPTRRYGGASPPLPPRTTVVSPAPGKEQAAGAHHVRALGTAADPAYAVTAPDGRRLLWTGGAPHGARAATPYDLVLLGGDAATAPHRLADLRERGAVSASTDVVLVDLSHDHPPAPELHRRATAWGVRVVPDGAVLAVGPQAGPPQTPTAPRRVLVLGGARSGKSVEAERRLLAEPSVTYVATGGRRDGDAEWAARVAGHRERRPAGWATVETTDVAGVLRTATGPVLVDCLALWLTAQLDLEDGWERGRTAGLDRAVDELVAAWRDVAVPVVAVSNEVGSGVVPGTPAGRLFRDELGRLNARLAAESDEVLLTVAGRVLRL